MRLIIAVELTGRDDFEFTDILGKLDVNGLEDHFGNLFDAFAAVEISWADFDHSNDQYNCSVANWQQEVANGDTQQSYEQWCESCRS